MNSPFPSSSSSPGEGLLVVRILPQGISALGKMTFQYPLKLISPSPSADQKSVLVFLLSYGGGLVGGDRVHLKIDVNPYAKLSLVTQGHTKIFKSPSRDILTRQQLDVTIQKGAGVCLLPDPVQPFQGSVYEQCQIFNLATGSSLCLLDWVSAGRIARGENWDLSAWSGRNEVWSTATSDRKARLLLRDNVLLEGDQYDAQEKLLRMKMQGNQLFGTLILRGPMMDSLAEFFLTEFASLARIGARDFRSQEKMDQDNESPLSHQEAWRTLRHEQEITGGLLWSAARVRSCTVIKFSAQSVEGGRTWIRSMLKQQGSVSTIFGEDAIMCLR